eukprot:UN05494
MTLGSTKLMVGNFGRRHGRRLSVSRAAQNLADLMVNSLCHRIVPKSKVQVVILKAEQDWSRTLRPVSSLMLMSFIMPASVTHTWRAGSGAPWSMYRRC